MKTPAEQDEDNARLMLQEKARNRLFTTNPIVIESNNIHSKRLYCGKKEINSIVAHCYSSGEIDAAKQLVTILHQLNGGRYLPIDTSRTNYKNKMKQGIRNFVVYDIEINEELFELKCSVKIRNRFTKEYPYSLKKKKGIIRAIVEASTGASRINLFQFAKIQAFFNMAKKIDIPT